MLVKIGRNWINPQYVRGIVEHEDYAEIMFEGDTGVVLDKNNIEETAKLLNDASPIQSFGGEPDETLV
jgi:hypothetical protein